MEILSKCNHLLYEKLRGWAVSRGTKKNFYEKYWHRHNGRKIFSTGNKENSLRLESYNPKGEHHSSVDYVKVKGDKSPYDGDWVYGRAKLGKHPNVPQRLAKILKYQKGKCNHCGHYFYDEDVIEIDHITPKSQGGKDEYKNLQALHRHCHHHHVVVEENDPNWT